MSIKEAYETYKTKAGSERARAIRFLANEAKKVLGYDPRSIKEVIQALDLEEPKIN